MNFKIMLKKDIHKSDLTWISKSFLYTAKGRATVMETTQMEMMTARARHWVILCAISRNKE
jgi:hypothetical protein